MEPLTHHEPSIHRHGLLWGVLMTLAMSQPASSTHSIDPATVLHGHEEPIPVVELSSEELAWLAQHPVIKVAFDPDWAPVEYIDANGQPAGISMEYLTRLEQMLKVDFQPLKGLTWEEAGEGLRDGSIHMASAVRNTEQRRAIMTFTSPYMSLPTAIFVRDSVAYAELSSLKGKRVATIQGFAVHDFLSLHYPDMPIIGVKSLKDGLDLVRQGKADAFIECFPIGCHAIHRHEYFDLHAAGQIDFRYDLSMAASVKHPILASILQKALSAIPETARVRYYQKLEVPVVYQTNFAIVWWVVAIAMAILLFVLFWNRRLEHRVAARTDELARANEQLESRVVARTSELEKAYGELLQRNLQYRELAAELVQTENRERRHIAQLLHDNLQQLLVAGKFKTDLILRTLSEPKLKESAREVLEILDQSIASSRSLTMELAPPVLHEAGLMPGMKWLAQWVEEQHGMTVDVSGTVPQTPIAEDQSILLFRAVKELLFNVVKHAGVREARVAMVATDEGVQVTVSDSGKGFDVTDTLATPRSFGLFHIKDRLSMLGGRMDITSSPGNGTKVDLYIPLTKQTSPT